MACNCNNVQRSLIRSIAVNSASTAVILTPDDSVTLENEGKFSFVVAASVPVAGMSLPAYMVVGGANVPIYDRFGNIIYGANLRTRFEYKTYYGTNGAGGTAHIQVVNYPIGRQCNC